MSVPLLLLSALLSIAAQTTICTGKCSPLNYGDKISFSSSGTAKGSDGIFHPQISCESCNVDTTEDFEIDCIHSGLNTEENIINWKCYPSNNFVLAQFKVSCEGVRQNEDTEYIYENSCSIAVSLEGSAISDLFRVHNMAHENVAEDLQSSIGGFFTSVGRFFSDIGHGIVSFFTGIGDFFVAIGRGISTFFINIGKFFLAVGRFIVIVVMDIILFFEYAFELAALCLLGVVLYNLIKYCYEPICHLSKGCCQNMYHMCEGCYDCLNHPSYYRLPTYDNSANLTEINRSWSWFITSSRAVVVPRRVMTVRQSTRVTSTVTSNNNLPRPDHVGTVSSQKVKADKRDASETVPPPKSAIIFAIRGPASVESQATPSATQANDVKQEELERIIPNTTQSDYKSNGIASSLISTLSDTPDSDLRAATIPALAANPTSSSVTSPNDKIVSSTSAALSRTKERRYDEESIYSDDHVDLHYSRQVVSRAKSVMYFTSVPITTSSVLKSSAIIVENIPVVSNEMIPKLLGVLLTIFALVSKITEADILMPFNEETQTTYGFCFIKFANKDEAENAMKLTQGLAIDKKHTFKISLYFDLDKYSKPHPSPPPVVITDKRKPTSAMFLKEFNALSKNGTDITVRDVYRHHVLPLFAAGSITTKQCNRLFECTGAEVTINSTLSYQQFERVMEIVRSIAPAPTTTPAVGSFAAAVATPIATCVVATPVISAVGVQSAPTLSNPASKCVQDSSKLSTLRVVPSRVLEDSPPPPQESMKNEGYWVEGDKFKGKKSFGHFRCACGNSWISAHTTKGKWQGCKGCETRSLPKYLWVNYEGRRGKREVGEEGGSNRGPHDMQRCQRCNELGYGCWNE